MKFIRFTFLIMSILIFSISYSGELAKTRICIMGFELSEGIDPDCGIFLQNMLIEVFLNNGRYRIIDSEKIDGLMKNVSDSQSKITTEDAKKQVMSDLRIEKMLVGSLSRKDEKYNLSVSMLNFDMTVENTFEHAVENEDALENAIKEIGLKLISESYKCTLTLNVIPDDANIRFLNIEKEFEQGMQLAPGLYHLEISYPGYKTEKEWTQLTRGLDRKIDIRLTKAPSYADEVREYHGIEFVYIPPGIFEMGSHSGDFDELPIHTVEITQGFWMGRYEITQEQWMSVMGTNPSSFEGDVRCPVENVTWDSVQEFISRLNAKGTGKFRLPKEAEWEYVSRGGRTTEYSYGEEDTGMLIFGWHNRNPQYKTSPVGLLKPNAWGLYDMAGNVWEWCQDWYGEDYYSKSPKKNPVGPSEGLERVTRGGCFFNSMDYCRPASRSKNYPDRAYEFVGFRIVREE